MAGQWSRALWIGALALAATRCSGATATTTANDAGSADAGAGVDPLADLRAACAGLSGALCTSFETCHPDFYTRLFASRDDCIATNADFCVRRALGEGSGTTAASMNACVQAMPPPTDCSAWDRYLVYFDGPPVCFPRGRLADGAPCQNDEQCQSGYCDSRGSGFCGECREPIAQGLPCSYTLQCVPGHRCWNGTCVAVARLGDACGADQPCEGDLWCDAGKCAPRPKPGGACPAGDTCQEGLGFLDSTCDTATGKCAAPVDSAAGDGCGVDSDGVVHLCGYGTTCQAASLTCIPNPKLGEACGPGLFENGCEGFGICWQGKCATQDPALCSVPGFPP